MDPAKNMWRKKKSSGSYRRKIQNYRSLLKEHPINLPNQSFQFSVPPGTLPTSSSSERLVDSVSPKPIDEIFDDNSENESGCEYYYSPDEGEDDENLGA